MADPKIMGNLSRNAANVLPEDMIEEIILRIPIDKLVRIIPYMGLGNLSYLSLKHLKIVSTKPVGGFLMDRETENLSKYIIYSCEKKEMRVLDQHKNMGVYKHLVGCSNGLICDVTIHFRQNEIVLQVMNPLLLTSVFLPQPSLPSNLEFMDIFGFGCMGLSGDFKVVRVVQVEKMRGIEIYSSKEGKWTQLDVEWPVYCNNRVALMDCPLIPLKISMGISSILLGSKLYWLVKEPGHDLVRGVIAFDMVLEKLEVVKSFSSQHVADGSMIGLGIFKGHMAAARESEMGGFEICLLHQDSEEWKRCAGPYPLQPAVYSLGLPNSEMIGPYPHVETLILSSVTMPSVIAALLLNLNG